MDVSQMIIEKSNKRDYKTLLHSVYYNFNFIIAQSAGAVEYTDCTSAEGQDPHQWVSWIWHLTIW